MRGRIVNLCIGLMNIFFGILLLIFTIYVPQDVTLLTVQENIVRRADLYGIYFIMVAVFGLNFIQYINTLKESSFKAGYMFGFFILSFIFIKQPAIAFFPILSGIIIVYKSLKENLVEIDSTLEISMTLVIITVIVILAGISLSYKQIGNYIKDKENENEQEFVSTYFRYITELGIDDIYINVKKDGKYGYINQRGEIVIDFKYDYASPFVKIEQYGKRFDIALVCIDGSSYIILKNQRIVMSYRSESSDQNYGAKTKELENIYYNILEQKKEMNTEVIKITDNISRIPIYPEYKESTDYTYRYDYNNEYDITVTKSNLGLGDKYELAKKENLNIRIPLDTEQLAYDENYLYIFSNGTIPFYNISNREQGWFTNYGKKISMTGKAQILDFFGDKILIKNYNDKTIYFIDDNGEVMSPAYKSIYVLQDETKYIVKNANGKYSVIDHYYNKVFDTEYDMIDPYLSNYGLYIAQNLDNVIEFNDYGYAKMSLKLVDSDGNVILDGIEQIYGNYYQISLDKSLAYSSRYGLALEEIKSMEYNFVGDEFYKIYK
ncbi:MAG: WG repeat-containing protein [Clostridia bacterium]|nr:WG repeat-containing protein [Clostridia bacterium]